MYEILLLLKWYFTFSPYLRENPSAFYLIDLLSDIQTSIIQAFISVSSATGTQVSQLLVNWIIQKVIRDNFILSQLPHLLSLPIRNFSVFSKGSFKYYISVFRRGGESKQKDDMLTIWREGVDVLKHIASSALKYLTVGNFFLNYGIISLNTTPTTQNLFLMIFW